MNRKISILSLFFIAFLFLNFRSDDTDIKTIGNYPDITPNNVTISAVDENFEQSLAKALEYLETVCGEDGIKKMVILKSGETAFSGEDADFVQNVWSCTKSFTSTVLGLLIGDGKCNLNDKVSMYLPELKEKYPDITFRHLATMTSGYKAIGDDKDSGHGQSRTPFQPSPDPNSAPGEEFLYWDSAMNMFALALTKVAGEPIEDYFKRKVAEPIGMNPGKWDWKDFGKIEGITVNGGAGNKSKGIFICATELAKFGQLFLNQGEWNGRQIIPQKWINEATSPQVINVIPFNNEPYGYNWWTSGTFPDAPENTFAALGFNNNKCIVIPEWDTVIVRLGLDGNVEKEKWNEFIKILAVGFEN